MKKKDLNISFGSSGKDLKYKSAKLTSKRNKKISYTLY